METTITQGIKISVEVSFQSDQSGMEPYQYVFAYRITIENQNDFAVQLLRRHWHIFSSDGTHREVEGAGVVGATPILEPSDRYQYISGCHLATEIGQMHGTYTMQKVSDRSTFLVNIPKFLMVVPFKLN